MSSPKIAIQLFFGGNKGFTATDISQGWDGMYNGKISDAGTFIYFINGTNSTGEVYFKGTVMLIH